MAKRAGKIILYIRVAAFMMACLMAFSRSAAQEPSMLEQISLKVQDRERELKKVGEKQSGLEGELKRIKLEVADLRAQEKSLTGDLQKKEEERKAVLEEIAESEKKMEQVEAVGRERIIALYKNKAAFSVSRLMLLKDNSRVGVNLRYLQRIWDFDRMLLAQLSGLQAEKNRRNEELQEIIRQQEALRTKIKSKGDLTSVRVKNQESVIQQIKAEKQKIQTALGELKAQALRLETVVAGITGAEVEDATTRRKGSKDKRPELQHEGGYSGPGLVFGAKKLKKPVDGSVVSRFGDEKPTGFEDFVLSKGVEFKADEGEAVFAVEEGTVMFAGKMPGLGSVAIIDHGKRSYSLYGRLNEISVSKGQVLDRGETVGLTGAPDGRAGNFYFEIRVTGKAVNPARYIAGI